MTRKSPKKHVVKSHIREKTPVKTYVRGHFLPLKIVKRRVPTYSFLVDENLPESVARELKREGYRVEHVNWIGFRKAPDPQIKRYAERHNMIILTRDVGFPEPRILGDRVLIVDVPKQTSAQEVLRRIKQLGWKK